MWVGGPAASPCVPLLRAAWWLGSQRAGPERTRTSSDWHFPDTAMDVTQCQVHHCLWQSQRSAQSLWEGDGNSPRSDERSVRITSQLEHSGPEVGLQGLGKDNLPREKIWVSS